MRNERTDQFTRIQIILNAHEIGKGKAAKHLLKLSNQRNPIKSDQLAIVADLLLSALDESREDLKSNINKLLTRPG